MPGSRAASLEMLDLNLAPPAANAPFFPFALWEALSARAPDPPQQLFALLSGREEFKELPGRFARPPLLTLSPPRPPPTPPPASPSSSVANAPPLPAPASAADAAADALCPCLRRRVLDDEVPCLEACLAAESEEEEEEADAPGPPPLGASHSKTLLHVLWFSSRPWVTANDVVEETTSQREETNLLVQPWSASSQGE